MLDQIQDQELEVALDRTPELMSRVHPWGAMLMVSKLALVSVLVWGPALDVAWTQEMA